MSCEQLRAEIDEKIERIPKGSKDRSRLLACSIVLDDGCPSNRPHLTHTSRMLKAETIAEVERVWQNAKTEVELLLSKV